MLDAGTGNDVLSGARGNDRIVGGPGVDLLSGGDGKDVLRAANGTRDVVRCGAGRDRAVVDRKDSVSSSGERVRVAR
jgi:serralysin